MEKLSYQDFVHKLDALDEDTSLFLAKYAEHRKAAKAQARISMLIATFGGVLVFVGSYFLPNATTATVVIVSSLCAAALGFWGTWERNRADRRLLECFLKQSLTDKAQSFRKIELIERYLKAEGL